LLLVAVVVVVHTHLSASHPASVSRWSKITLIIFHTYSSFCNSQQQQQQARLEEERKKRQKYVISDNYIATTQ